jgi:hypothetical protein
MTKWIPAAEFGAAANQQDLCSWPCGLSNVTSIEAAARSYAPAWVPAFMAIVGCACLIGCCAFYLLKRRGPDVGNFK